MADKERIQLNLRLDGRPDLLEAIKEAAKAEDTSINSWVVGVLAETARLNLSPKDSQKLRRN
jgi:predicted HicB family RNase H-like nuclease